MSDPQDPYAPPSGGVPRPPTQGYGPPPGWQQPAEPPAWAAPKTNTKAMITLGLAISAYLPIVPFVGAVVALFLAGSARREILASGGRETGLGLVTAARVLAIVHLVFVALLVVFVVFVLAVPFAFT